MLVVSFKRGIGLPALCWYVCRRLLALLHSSGWTPTELIRRRVAVIENGFADIVVWHVHKPVPGSTHNFKYRLAFVVDGHAYCDTTTNLEKEITGTSEVERSPIYSLIRVS